MLGRTDHHMQLQGISHITLSLLTALTTIWPLPGASLLSLFSGHHMRVINITRKLEMSEYSDLVQCGHLDPDPENVSAR
jgi:hypothetical protein